MLKYKQFKESCEDKKFNKFDYPAVVIDHGSHAYEPLEDDSEFNKFDYPAVVIDHGSHNIPKDKSNEIVKEDFSGPSWEDINDNKHLGFTQFDVHEKLEKNKTPLGLESQHKKAVKLYTTSSAILNKRLLDDFKEKRTQHRWEYDGINLDHLDEATKHPLNHELHVYSGIGFHPEKKANEEGIIHLPGYTSTSINRKVAAGFSEDKRTNKIIHFHLHPGHKGLYVGDLGQYKHEREFLLPRNTTIKIHNLHDPEEVNTDSGYKFHVYHAHILNQE